MNSLCGIKKDDGTLNQASLQPGSAASLVQMSYNNMSKERMQTLKAKQQTGGVEVSSSNY